MCVGDVWYFIHACVIIRYFCMFCISREHLSEEDLRKNKAVLEGLTKGHLVDNPEVKSTVMLSYML